MDMENLVGMANRIGTFFESMPERDEALKEIRDHIRRYWPPVMRRGLLEQAAAESGSGLHPLVKAMLMSYAAELVPQESGPGGVRPNR
ncbi:MAG: hypothetical protein RJA36_3752 [Pseudomonadota bacterium]|jgi:formate dehydrogenase subunit delta